jgi:predicted TIM-barrel fold metal-dependent hydrolase
MSEFKGAIDTVLNLQTEEVVTKYRSGWGQTFHRDKIGASDETVNGVATVARLVEKLDNAGIDKAFLLAVKCGPKSHPESWHLPYEVVADAVQQFPDRFYGLAGVDPTEGMAGLRELERGIKEYGFIGAHLYPHWFEMAPDHARYYPIYAKCAELDIPIQMQVGHCLRYSSTHPLKSVGRPITLDTIACDFPELKLVGIHLGWPWTEEMIAVAYKHPNVYIAPDAYAPKHWPKEYIHFINTFGQDKVMFGTDYPIIDPERAMKEIDELDLRPIPKQKFLRDNAMKLYGLS